MSKNTHIQWCDSSVNPTMGCDGCELWNAKNKTCYAGVLHGRYGGKNAGFSPTFDKLTLYPGRMAEAARWSDLRGKDRADKPWFNGHPRTIFVSDMSDALSADVPFDYLKTEIVDVVKSEAGRRHRWMWLTKQAARMADFSLWLTEKHACGWPMNLWAGTSVTTQSTIGRVKALRAVGDGNTTRFVSAEPLWEGVAFREYLPWMRLVIVGGESGPGARPCDLQWIGSILLQCKDAGTACFVKQLGAKPVEEHDGSDFELCDVTGIRSVKLKDPKGGAMSEWPEVLRVREFPTEVSHAT